MCKCWGTNSLIKYKRYLTILIFFVCTGSNHFINQTGHVWCTEVCLVHNQTDISAQQLKNNSIRGFWPSQEVTMLLECYVCLSLYSVRMSGLAGSLLLISPVPKLRARRHSSNLFPPVGNGKWHEWKNRQTHRKQKEMETCTHMNCSVDVPVSSKRTNMHIKPEPTYMHPQKWVQF